MSTAVLICIVVLAVAAGSGWGIVFCMRAYGRAQQSDVAMNAIEQMHAVTISALRELPAAPAGPALLSPEIQIAVPRVEPVEAPDATASQQEVFVQQEAPPARESASDYERQVSFPAQEVTQPQPVFIKSSNARLRPWYIPAALYKPSSLEKSPRARSESCA